MNRSLMAGLLLAVVLALAFRCPRLGERPMHNDEAVNAIKFRSLWQQGDYHFDPNEHHGPALFYSTLAWSKLTGAPAFPDFDEARLRIVPVLFGIGLILLLPLVTDGLGRNATICAGVLTAISPALVYYSRDYIHEMLLVFFTFLALGCGWRYYRSRKLFWAILTGGAIGLMQSTKETFVLPLVAAAVALVVTKQLSRQTNPNSNPSPARVSFRHLLIGVGTWSLVAILFFSSFFTNAAGPLDALRTYLPWTERAAGNSPHLHPWHFYLDHLIFFHVRNGPIWSEGLILLLALTGIFSAFTQRTTPDTNAVFLRFLAIYTLLLTLVYSLIPYKTPWCLLGFWHGMILLAGTGAATILNRLRGRRTKLVVGLTLLVATGQLGWQAWRAAESDAADRRNPYVYAQTSPDVLTLTEELEAIAGSAAAGHRLLINVVAPGSDYWPLPWYLRGFDQVGWWSEMPAQPPAPVLIVSTKLKEGLNIGGTHLATGMYQLRPDNFVEVYVQSNLWHTFVDSREK